MEKKTFLKASMLVGTTLVFTVLPFFSFSREQKDNSIREHESRCEKCGKTFPANQLYAHHILPEQFGGATNPENLYLACTDCHREVDRDAINKGRLANGLVVTEVLAEDPHLIGDFSRYQKAAKRFQRR